MDTDRRIRGGFSGGPRDPVAGSVWPSVNSAALFIPDGKCLELAMAMDG